MAYSKDETKEIIGTAGARGILEHISAITQERSERLATIAIGGINASNVQRVLYQSRATFKGLDGVAVTRSIMAAENPESAAAELRSLVTENPPFGIVAPGKTKTRAVEELLARVPGVVEKLGEEKPLFHNMTNLVVQNFAANVALAMYNSIHLAKWNITNAANSGATPIMVNNGAEAEDLARIAGSLVINMGTATSESLTSYLRAIRAYNRQGRPVLLDPVGAGATMFRQIAVQTLMNGGWFQVIKGNENEIMTIAGFSNGQQKGVDGGKSTTSHLDKARAVKKLAARERNIVVMTGATDYLSDGELVYAIFNGHSFLGQITGSGCTLGTTIAAFLAVEKDDKLLAVLAGVLMFVLAAEHAAHQPDVKGPGTFVPAFIDALAFIACQAEDGDATWLQRAKVEMVEL